MSFKLVSFGERTKYTVYFDMNTDDDEKEKSSIYQRLSPLGLGTSRSQRPKMKTLNMEMRKELW